MHIYGKYANSSPKPFPGSIQFINYTQFKSSLFLHFALILLIFPSIFCNSSTFFVFCTVDLLKKLLEITIYLPGEMRYNL